MVTKEYGGPSRLDIKICKGCRHFNVFTNEIVVYDGETKLFKRLECYNQVYDPCDLNPTKYGHCIGREE